MLDYDNKTIRRFTFFYFPILPLNRQVIRRIVTHPAEFEFIIIRNTPISMKEVFKTYLWGWILTPLVVFWPFPFAVREVGEYFGYTNDKAEGTLYWMIIIFAIAWLIISVWNWKDYDDVRGLPRNYKALLAAQELEEKK